MDPIGTFLEMPLVVLGQPSGADQVTSERYLSSKRVSSEPTVPYFNRTARLGHGTGTDTHTLETVAGHVTKSIFFTVVENTVTLPCRNRNRTVL